VSFMMLPPGPRERPECDPLPDTPVRARNVRRRIGRKIAAAAPCGAFDGR